MDKLVEILRKCSVEDMEYISKVLDSNLSFTNDRKRKSLLDKARGAWGGSSHNQLVELVDEQVRYFGSSDAAYLKRSIFSKNGGVSASELISDVYRKLTEEEFCMDVDVRVEARLEHLVRDVVDAKVREIRQKSGTLNEFLSSNFGVDDDLVREFVMKVSGVNGGGNAPALMYEVFGREMALGVIKCIVDSVSEPFLEPSVVDSLKRGFSGDDGSKYAYALPYFGPAIVLANNIQGAAFRKTVPICLHLGFVSLRDELNSFDENNYAEFEYMLANIMFRVDGDMSDDECEWLVKKSEVVKKQVKDRIDGILESDDKFVEVRDWYKSLGKIPQDRLSASLARLAHVDKKRTVEKEAFMIQMAQISNGNDKLKLYVSRDKATMRQGHFKNNLFEYIGADEFLEKSTSCSQFNNASIYVDNPFVDNELMAFSPSDFEVAQGRLYDGLIPLLKDLGAKKFLMSEISSTKDLNEDSVSVGVSVSAKKVGGASLESGMNFSELVDIHKKESVEVTFDGAGAPLMNFFKSDKKLKKELLAKYRGNKIYVELIEGRFGENKITSFKYKIKSNDARKIDSGIRASVKFDKGLVKGSVRVGYNSLDDSSMAIEKELDITF